MKSSARAIAFLLAGVAAIALPALASAQAACTHYAAPVESEGGRAPVGETLATRQGAGTAEQPFTVADFWEGGSAKPGAVLCLRDGFYRGDRSMIRPPRDLPLHGQAESPVEVRAENDGEVWIDGEFARSPVRIAHDHWTVTGLNAFNSVGPAVSVRGVKQAGPQAGQGDARPVTGVVLRRIVAWRDFLPYGTKQDYDAIGGGNTHTFDISDAKDVLVEDCAGFGWARKVFQVYRSQRVTLRRGWARWDGRYPYTRRNKIAFACSYKAYDSLCENLIATAGGARDEAAMPGSYAPSVHLIAGEGSEGGQRWMEPSGRDPNDLGLRVLGSLAYLPTGSRFSRVAGFRFGGSGYPDRGVKGVRLANSLAFVPGQAKPALQLRACKDDPEKYADGCSWKRGASRDEAPLVVERVTAAVDGENGVRVGKDWRRSELRVVSSSKPPDPYRGAASLCHRTVNGVRTAEPLWPWPMQERIFAATERSSWQTADVMGEIVSIFGSPPAECSR